MMLSTQWWSRTLLAKFRALLSSLLNQKLQTSVSIMSSAALLMQHFMIILREHCSTHTEPRHSRPLSVADSLMSPRSEYSETSSLYGGSNYQYPDTDELLKIAQQISASHEQVDRTATKMLRSANTVSCHIFIPNAISWLSRDPLGNGSAQYLMDLSCYRD